MAQCPPNTHTGRAMSPEPGKCHDHAVQSGNQAEGGVKATAQRHPRVRGRHGTDRGGLREGGAGALPASPGPATSRASGHSDKAKVVPGEKQQGFLRGSFTPRREHRALPASCQPPSAKVKGEGTLNALGSIPSVSALCAESTWFVPGMQCARLSSGSAHAKRPRSWEALPPG